MVAKVERNVEVSDTKRQCKLYGKHVIVKSRCEVSVCAAAKSTVKENFLRAGFINDNDKTRPMLNITIMGKKGVATVDTGAIHCIASPSLYKILVEKGVSFTKPYTTMTLADGSCQNYNTLSVDASVIVVGRKIVTTFLVVPDSNTRTL
ncbi:hypothetical protein EVAR_57404_1 [Eumeta japonica]|uniref:Peptidase A2 domain-containing protein n=1 Tax=Eumeta variegata TaxID=151549 RepID=A0A4C1YFT2_EUMVA|nr:hypothetical protein EVAR_57404_1 [Eumeta japonica]